MVQGSSFLKRWNGLWRSESADFVVFGQNRSQTPSGPQFWSVKVVHVRKRLWPDAGEDVCMSASYWAECFGVSSRELRLTLHNDILRSASIITRWRRRLPTFRSWREKHVLLPKLKRRHKQPGGGHFSPLAAERWVPEVLEVKKFSWRFLAAGVSIRFAFNSTHMLTTASEGD